MHETRNEIMKDLSFDVTIVNSINYDVTDGRQDIPVDG